MKFKSRDVIVSALVLLVVASSLPVTATEPYYLPVIEVLDLRIDGTTPTRVNSSYTFAHIKRMIFGLKWEDNEIDFASFGTDADGLDNGIAVQYYFGNDLINLTNNNPIKNFNGFFFFAYDTVITSDDKNPVNNQLICEFSFIEFMIERKGLVMYNDEVLSFLISDNITDTCDDFIVTLEGYSGGVEVTNVVPADINPLFQAMDNILSYLPVLTIGAIALVATWFLFRKFIKT